MKQQIQAVLWTYVHRALSGSQPAMFVFIGLWGVVMIAMITKAERFAGFGGIACFGPGLLAIHFKEQIVHVRERRLPGALMAHIGVTVALLLLIALGLPLLHMSFTGTWNFGYPGVVMALSAFVFVAILIQSTIFSFVFIAFIFGACQPAVQQWINELLLGHLESSGLVLLLTGLAAIPAAIFWTLRLTEEDRQYVLRMTKTSNLYQRGPVSDSMSTNAAKEIWSNRWMRPLDPSERTIAQWPSWAQGSLWDRVRL